jgi:PAS domain S-box-containing protein/putative nucleotidyltransferase with HDIG domain
VSVPLRVLHVEDSEDDHLLVLRTLKQGGYVVKAAARCETQEEMRLALAAQPWDIILCDHKLPHFDSFGALQVLKESGLDLPFIIVSGTIAGEVAVEAMRVGAQDFIFKFNLTRLVPAIQRELRDAEGRRARKQAEQALRATDEQLQTLIRSSPIGVTVLDPDGMVKLWNPANEAVFGWTAADALGKFLPYIPEDKREEFKIWRDRVLQGESFTGVEVLCRRKDGSPIYLSVAAAPLRDAQGKITSILDMTLDISGPKQQEERIQRQLERLTALSEIDRAIVSSTDLKVSLSVLLAHVAGQLGVDAVAVLLFDPGLQVLEYALGRGFHTNVIETTQVRLGKSYAGRAALERRMVAVPNLELDPDNTLLTVFLAGENFVSYYGVPLISKGIVQGVLEVYHRSPLEPDAEWLDFLNTLAGQVAIAIDNATLFDNLQRSNDDLSMAYDATIAGWSHALDLRDKETEGHTQRVTEMTLKLARAFGLSERELVQVRWGALLHDIGKMGVPDSILFKPGPLTEEEWVVMKKHPIFAYEMLAPISYLRQALDIPYCHHEKWDGSGYPRGLKAEQIPLVARIFAVVDVWDALRSDRPYRAAWKAEKVREHILSSSGTHFDPQVVDAFLQMAD